MNTNKPKSKQAFSWRLIYAFAIVWLAGFALLSPLVRRGPTTYRSTAEIRFALNSGSQTNADELVSLLRNVVAHVTQLSSIEQICEQLPPGTQSQSPLKNCDSTEIIRRLRIAQTNHDGSVNLTVAIDGKGGRDEMQFVNLLANRLAIEVPRQSDHAALTRWIKSNSDSLDMSKQVHLAEQIRAEVAEINGSISQIKEHLATTDLESMTTLVQSLEARKLQLKQAQNLDDTHPEIVQLQSQIEQLRMQMLSNPDFRPVQLGVDHSSDSPDLIKNRFYQASIKTTEGANAKFDFNAALSAIDLSHIGGAATQLKAQAESIRDLKQDIDANLIESNQTASSYIAAFDGVSYSTRPNFIPGPQPIPTWLVTLPCLLAAAVALYYNPLRDRMQLKTIEDVVKSMGIGVIGELPSNQSAITTGRGERWSAISVRFAEYSLLAIGGLLIVSCVMRPQILSVAITNPLLAISNWFWLIAG